MSFDWGQVQPGDVLAWVPPTGTLARRVLVEEIEADDVLHDPRYRWVWGVEISSRYNFRLRRGARGYYPKPFLISCVHVQDTARGGERITALQARLVTLRGAR